MSKENLLLTIRILTIIKISGQVETCINEVSLNATFLYQNIIIIFNYLLNNLYVL